MSSDKAHVEFVEMAAAALLASLHFVCNFARDEPTFRKELIGRVSMYDDHINSFEGVGDGSVQAQVRGLVVQHPHLKTMGALHIITREFPDDMARGKGALIKSMAATVLTGSLDGFDKIPPMCFDDIAKIAGVEEYV